MNNKMIAIANEKLVEPISRPEYMCRIGEQIFFVPTREEMLAANIPAHGDRFWFNDKNLLNDATDERLLALIDVIASTYMIPSESIRYATERQIETLIYSKQAKEFRTRLIADRLYDFVYVLEHKNPQRNVPIKEYIDYRQPPCPKYTRFFDTFYSNPKENKHQYLTTAILITIDSIKFNNIDERSGILNITNLIERKPFKPYEKVINEDYCVLY
jgi:hypothetical protein